MRYEWLINFTLIAVISLSFLFDAHSIYLKTEKTVKRGEYMAYAHLMQYISRLINMVAVFSMAILYENFKLKIDFNAVLFFSSLLGVLFLVAGLRFKMPYYIVAILSYPIVMVAFKKLRNENTWQIIRYRKLNIKIFMASVVTYLLILIGIFLPFFIAERYPDMRMSSVYIGQIINFMSTLTILAYLEPSLMRMLDLSGNRYLRMNLIYSRIFSYSSIVLIVGTLWLI